MTSEALRGLDALGDVAPPAAASSTPSAGEVGARVAAARAQVRLTGEQLAKALGLRKDQISKIESGVRKVSVRELPALANALGVTVGYLLGQPASARLAMAHRLTQAVAEPAKRQAARARALQLLEVEDALARRAGVPPQVTEPAGARLCEYARSTFTTRPRNRDEAQLQGRRLAEAVRAELGLGHHEIGDLAGLIERTFGVDVALSPLGTAADGLCVHGGGVALIVASSDFSDGHVRFTLAHELGHHLLGDPREVIDEAERDMFAGDLAEKRVNAFAGHLLVPAEGVGETLGWVSAGVVTERALVALMDRFQVSLAALVFQLNVLRVITFDQGQRLRDGRVSDLVARHQSVAPRQAALPVRRIVRSPERLLGAAMSAAQAQQVGLSVVATLLERDDDDALWDEVMEAGPADEALAAVQLR